MYQHYVPRFYLQLFVGPATPLIETDWLWECQLRTGKIRRKAPKNVATRPDYYTLPNGPPEVAQSVEESFSKLESTNAPIIRRLALGNLTLSEQERAELLFFLAMLATRVPAFRNRIENLYEDVGRNVLMMSASRAAYFANTMRKAMAAAGKPIPSDDEIEEHRRWALDPDNYTLDANPIVSLAHGFQLALELIYPIFAQMRAFYTAPEDIQYVTSDCPVSWYDPTPRPAFYRGHGLGMRHVEVTFPVSPTVAMLGTYEGGDGVFGASASQVVLFNVRRLYWTDEYVYAGSEASARGAFALAVALSARGISPETT